MTAEIMPILDFAQAVTAGSADIPVQAATDFATSLLERIEGFTEMAARSRWDPPRLPTT